MATVNFEAGCEASCYNFSRQLTDKLSSYRPLPVILSLEKLIIGVRNIPLSHLEVSPHKKTRTCPNKQENGSDPKTGLRELITTLKGHGLASAIGEMGIQGHSGKTVVPFWSTSGDAGHTGFLNSPPQYFRSSATPSDMGPSPHLKSLTGR